MSVNSFIIGMGLILFVCGLVASFSAFATKNHVVVAASGIVVGLAVTLLQMGLSMHFQIVP